MASILDGEEQLQAAVPMDEDTIEEQNEDSKTFVTEEQAALNKLPEVRLEYDDSKPPISGLKFCGEQDGYRYYVHPFTHQCFSLTYNGEWYYQLPSQEFVEITEDIRSEMVKVRRTSRYIQFDDEGHSIYPKDESGFPVLPLDEKGGKIFPFDEMGLPVFPWDPLKKQWTLPVDDTHQAVFPFNEQGYPLVPVDENERAIFPIDAEGAFVFPLGSDGLPMPAMTPGHDGKWVVPTDSHGEPVVPFDSQGNPLIHITSDGIPVSQATFREWQQMHASSFDSAKKGDVDVQKNDGGDTEEVDYKASIQNFMRSKRVRPEDIDLPDPMAQFNHSQSSPGASTQAVASPLQQQQQHVASSFMQVAQTFQMAPGQQEETPMQIDTENDAADKRKRMLSLQLKRQLKLQKAAEDGASPSDETKELKLKPIPIAKVEKPKLIKQKMEMWVPPDSSKTIERIREESQAVATHINRRRSPDRRRKLDSRRDVRGHRDRSPERSARDRRDADRERPRRSRSRDNDRHSRRVRDEDRKRIPRSRSREAPARRRRSRSREERHRNRRSRSRENIRRERRRSKSVEQKSEQKRRRSRSRDRVHHDDKRKHGQPHSLEKKRDRSRSLERPQKKVEKETERASSRHSQTSRDRDEKKKQASGSPSPKRARRSASRESTSGSSSESSSSSTDSDSSTDSESPVRRNRKVSEPTVASKWDDSPTHEGSQSPQASDRKVVGNGKHRDEDQ